MSKNWIKTKLGDIAVLNPRIRSDDYSDGLEVSFIPMKAVQEETGNFSKSETRYLSEVKKGYTSFKDGDLIFAKITPCMENGKTAVLVNLKNGIGYGSTEFHVIRLFRDLSKKFFFFYIVQRLFREDARRSMTGSAGQLRVPKSYLEEVEVPLPPLPEQHRIVAKIEALFTQLDKGVEQLTAIQQQLKIYRQAVLKAAFEGKLTAAWRKQHQPPAAGELLAQIQVERQQQYEKALKDWKAAVKAWERNRKEGKKPGKPTAPKEYESLTEEELGELADLPEGWMWVKLDKIVTEIFDGPFGSNLKSSDYVQEGIRVIRLENIGFLAFNNEKLSFVSDEKYQTIKKHTVKGGDIIFSSFIADETRVVVLPKFIEKAINKADCFCIRISDLLIKRQFVTFFLSSKTAYHQLVNLVHGATRPRINTTQLKNCPIPLCSSEEQHQIVQEIESRLSVCDQLEKAIAGSLQQADALRQSILKKAFEGKLVPQDPADEPAGVLLERIRKEKAKT